MIDVKPWYKSKTVGLALLQAASGVLAAIFAEDPALKTVGVLAIIKSIVDLLIRANTTETIV